jgi:hypothetical protein
MAGIGPYGIEQFDAPGVIANMQNTQFNRVRMMMAQKQLEMTERQMNIQAGTMQALQAYAASLNGGSSGGAYGTGAGSSSGASGSATSNSGASNTGSTQSVSGGSPAPVTSMPHAADVVEAPTGPYDRNGIPTAGEMANRQRVLTGLAVFNPEMASQLSDTFKNMDVGQVAAVTARHTRIAQLAAGALQLPQNERAAFIQQHAAELQSLGMPAQNIANFNPTDGNLRGLVAEGMDIERVAQFSRPDVVSVREGGAAVTVNPDETSTTNYESPVMHGPNGEVFARPPSLSTMPHAPTATDAHGNKVQWDGSKWVPMTGGQTQPASGNFQ